ncbi:MAG: hydroxymethylbilane synthase [Pseudomonadota bacterium]
MNETQDFARNSVTAARLTIGTRGSPLALAQAHEVRDLLVNAHVDLAEPDAIAIRIIKTTGDKVQDKVLADIGGKGLFTKEIEDALIVGEIDVAVHSMKDVPTWLPPGLTIRCLLQREDPRDAFISSVAASLIDLPPGAVVGTASLRRQAQVLALRPDLSVVPLRGNVDTRLRKLADGEVEATLLAVAGLNRLGRRDAITAALDPEEMLPAVAQGAIGLETREDDQATQELLSPLNCSITQIRVTAERALLAELDGNCRTPIAALAETNGTVLHLRGLVASPDGASVHRVVREGPASDAERLGADAGAELLALSEPVR